MRRKFSSCFIKMPIFGYAKSYLNSLKGRIVQKNLFLDVFSERDLQRIFRDLFSRDGSLVRDRFLDFRGKIASIDVQVDWKEIVESLLLTLLTMLLYMSVVLAEFSFIPFMIIVIKRGWKETFIYLTWSIIILYFLNMKNINFLPMNSGLFLFSPIHYSFQYIGNYIGIRGRGLFDYYFLYGAFGIFLGQLVDKNYKLRYVIFISVLTYIGLIFVTFLIAGALNGSDKFISGYYKFVDEATANYINNSMAHLNNYRGILSTRGIDYLDFEKKITLAAKIYKKDIIFGLAPKGGYLIKQIVMVFLGIFFVKLYFRGKIKKASLEFDIIDFKMNNTWIWGLIFSWGLVYINLYMKNNILDIVSWNSTVIFSFLFFLRGLSVIKLIVTRLGVPQFTQYIIFLFLILYSFILFIALITGLGVIDIWFHIKDKLQKSDEENGS